MRQKRIYLLISLLSFILTGCIHEYPDGTGNHPISLVWTSDHPDELTGIRLWIFDEKDVLIKEVQFADLAEARQTNVELPAAPCKLVAATCPTSHYTCEAVPGKTRRGDLLITVNTPGSNPPHIQSGTAIVTAESGRVEIRMTRILSELEFLLKKLPPEVVKVRAEVLNSADGFYPGTTTLTDRNTTIALGELAPDAEGNVHFPLIRLMPVTNVPVSRVAQPTTQMAVTMITTGGEEVTFDVVAPTIESGGYYDPEAGYEQFKVGTVVIATIKDWDDGNHGEEGDVH